MNKLWVLDIGAHCYQPFQSCRKVDHAVFTCVDDNNIDVECTNMFIDLNKASAVIKLVRKVLAQVILYSGESLITQRPLPEMSCIYCNGGVWKIQLFHFYSGI